MTDLNIDGTIIVDVVVDDSEIFIGLYILLLICSYILLLGIFLVTKVFAAM